MQDHITPNLKKLARLLKKKGELYIVGGYVRNVLSDIFSSDIDIASKITTAEIKELLAGTEYKVKEISRKMGTCVISLGEEKWEHSTFRREEYANDGSHIPEKVEFITSVREDAKRRDFTVNAIYYNILKNEILDFYDGLEDLKKKVIRCIETPRDVLKDDGVRILRMIRIASEIGFKIASESLVVAYEERENLEAISGERKFSELYQIIMAPEKYRTSKKSAHIFGLEMLNLLKLWRFFGLEVSKIRFKLTKKAPYELRFYAFVIDCINSVKPDSQTEFIEMFLGKNGLGLPARKIEDIKTIIKGYYEALAGRNNKKYFLRYFEDFSTIVQLLEIKSKNVAKKYTFFYNYLINNKIPIRIKDLKISGQDIRKSYPQVAEINYKFILQLLLERVFDGFVLNERKDLIDEIKKII